MYSLPMMDNRPFLLSFLLLLLLLLLLCQSTCSTWQIPKNILDDEVCSTCKKISEKFIEGYRLTAGSNFGGGNTDWEEKKLKAYAKSETRLIEIMENACSKTESQCSTFLEKYEEPIEEWYQTSSQERLENFYPWLCIDTAKVCCPQGTFGKNCRRCSYGDNGRVCSGNGDCDGDGNRSGNGRCVCHTKYSGTNCSNCQSGYTKSINQSNQVICTDIDECRANMLLTPCLLYKCNNTEGAYECYGQPFYREVSKMSTLGVLLLTAAVLSYNELYGLASISLTTVTVLIILFAKNLL